METESQESQFNIEAKPPQAPENMDAQEALDREWEQRFGTNPTRENLNYFVESARGRGWVKKG